MDTQRFDHLTRLFSTPDTRRRVLGLAAIVPVLGGLFTLSDAEDVLGRRRHRHHVDQEKKKKKKKKKKKACKPQSTATVCAGKCGTITNAQTCNKPVNCGPCDCATPCGACFTCDAATRTCKVDPKQVGEACGSLGQVCAADGTCACSSSSCPSCTTCEAGICTGCAGCCDGDTCVTACGACQVCDGGQCVSCPGCCDGAGVCQAGDTDAACGTSGETCAVCTGQDACMSGDCVCQPTTCAAEGKTCGTIGDGCEGDLACGSCSNPTPICSDHVCVPCSHHTDCAHGALCCGGSCVAVWANQTTFGSYGSGPSQLAYPYDVAVAREGLTAWVVDYANSRISVWSRPNTSSTAWTNQTTFGSEGTGASQFSIPTGVAVAPDGLTAWVADYGNSRISVWSRPNTSSTAWTNQTTFGNYGSGPSQFRFPIGVAVTPDGLTAWVAENNNSRVSVWSRPNTSSTAWTNQTTFGNYGSGPNQLAYPEDVAVAPDGLTAWVVDFGNRRISVWSRPDAISTAWTNQTTFGSEGTGASQFSSPKGVAVAPDGLTAWVDDGSNRRISIWTRPGTASTDWTNQTTFGSYGTGPNQFAYPNGVAVAPDGLTAWVADYGNHRISIWGQGCPA